MATPPGSGALSLVRLSGPRARQILLAVFVPSGQAPFAPRRVRHGRVGEIDEGLAWWAPAPGTYTGEEVAEFSGHGGNLVTGKVLQAFLEGGARLAEAGEFTRRAYLNGRMDLARAEAVADLISATTEEALRVARQQLGGGLSERILALRGEVVDTLAEVEAAIDFPEEDIAPRKGTELAEKLERVAGEVAHLAASFQRGRRLKEGARVALVGRPNVGKSSLLNALVGSERAIVTEEPGTTRDAVEAQVDLDGLPVTLCDTAGIREGQGRAEQEGIRRSRELAGDADLVVFVHDLSAGVTEPDLHARESLSGIDASRVIEVGNKADLRAAGSGLAVSATRGTGLELLRQEIVRRLVGGSAERESALVVTSARHQRALLAAEQHLRTAAGLVRAAASPDLVASDIRRGLEALGGIVGGISNEEVLGRIFERFCVGK